MVRVGILGLQGDVLEHYELLKEIEGVEPVIVKDARSLALVDALVIPGGESTTIGRLIEMRGLRDYIIERVRSGMPILGTCAGTILLATRVEDREVGEVRQPLLKVMDIHVLRNAFGRQKDSFEAEVDIESIGRVKGAFIRAPIIKKAWGKAKIIGRIKHPVLGKIGVAAIQDNMLAVVFHPEITGDNKVHLFLIDMAKGRM